MIINCIDLSIDMGFQLVCPAERYENITADTMKLVKFYESELRQSTYS